MEPLVIPACTKSQTADHGRARKLGLSEAEIALYDAIIQNDSAILKMGDETLKKIARELVATIRSSATLDWKVKESVRAKMRSNIKRLLRKYGYPQDKREQAAQLVIQQAEHLAAGEQAVLATL